MHELAKEKEQLVQKIKELEERISALSKQRYDLYELDVDRTYL